SSPVIAYASSTYLIAWEESGNIYAQRFQPDLTPIPNTLTISNAAQSESSPAVAASSANFYVAWQFLDATFSWDIKGRRVTPAGSLGSTSTFTPSTSGPQEAPTVASDGSGWLVAWQHKPASAYDIWARRVNSTGTLNSAGNFAVSSATSSQWNPAAAFNAATSRYFVVWEDFRNGATADIYGARVSNTSNTVYDPSGIAMSPLDSAVQAAPVVATGNSTPDFMIAWYDNRNSIGDIYGTRAGPAGGWGPYDPGGLLIAKAGNKEQLPAVAFDGTNYQVVWQDHRKVNWNDTDIYAARVSGTVNPDGTSTVLGTFGVATSTAIQARPDVAFDGANYLVVWQDNRSGTMDIWGTRVSPAGTVLDTSGLDISGNQTGTQELPAVAFGSNATYLVVWRDTRTPGNNGDIWAGQVNTSGAIGTRFAVHEQAAEQTAPDIASLGANMYMVVWEDWQNKTEFNKNSDINSRLVVSTSPLPAVWVTTASYQQQQPAVVFGGTTYLVAWEDCRTIANGCDPGGPDIYAATIDPNTGNVGTNNIIDASATDQRTLDLAWTGSNFSLAWLWRFNATPPTWEAGVEGKLVDTSGLPVGTAWQVGTATDIRRDTPAIACNPGNGNCLVPHIKFDTAVQTDRLRAFNLLP
ncbi:MAG TPA: hypothetical protein VL172_04910, partial [Kofleriaceae bacterium]|nr:hypothetical protein [Kofleriaceae bacterium]